MTVLIAHTSIDCTHAYELSEWWKAALGYVDMADDPNEPGHEECMILDPETGHRLLFIEVPDRGTAKNSLHLDVRPRESTRDEEVTALLAHGATLHEDHRGTYGPGTGWVTLADPEGNLFCVLRSLDEVHADD